MNGLDPAGNERDSHPISSGLPQEGRFMQTDPDFPFNSFRKRLFKLTRKQASFIMQIRTKHIPLNYYLKRIGKTDSDKCLKCNGNENPDNVQVTETITHFLFKCQAHDEARQSLVDKIGRSRFTVPKIMKNTDHMKALLTGLEDLTKMKTTDISNVHPTLGLNILRSSHKERNTSLKLK